MRVRSEWIIYSLIAAGWSAGVAMIAGFLNWGDTLSLAVAMVAVPVLLLHWGRHDELAGSRSSRRTT
jgi:hypothetical protein